MPNSLQNADYIFGSKTIPSDTPVSLGSLRFVRGSLCVGQHRLSDVLRVSPALPLEAIVGRAYASCARPTVQKPCCGALSIGG